MKKLLCFALSVILLLPLIACQANNRDMEIEQHPEPEDADSAIAAIELPEDFAFYFSCGIDYYTSYDSSTGKLTEMYPCGNEKSGKVRYVKLSQYELKMVYKWIFDEFDFFSLPADLTPYFERNSAGTVVTSNHFYQLKIVSDGNEKTVKLDDLFYAKRMGDEYKNEADSFSKIAEELSVLILTLVGQ